MNWVREGHVIKKCQRVAYMPSLSGYSFNKHQCNAILACATITHFYVVTGGELSLEWLLWQQWLTDVEGVKVSEATHCLVQQRHWVQAWVRTAWVLHILHTKNRVHGNRWVVIIQLKIQLITDKIEYWKCYYTVKKNRIQYIFIKKCSCFLEEISKSLNHLLKLSIFYICQRTYLECKSL